MSGEGECNVYVLQFTTKVRRQAQDLAPAGLPETFEVLPGRRSAHAEQLPVRLCNQGCGIHW